MERSPGPAGLSRRTEGTSTTPKPVPCIAVPWTGCVGSMGYGHPSNNMVNIWNTYRKIWENHRKMEVYHDYHVVFLVFYTACDRK